MPCSLIYYRQFHGSVYMRIKPGHCKKEYTEKCFFQIKILDLIALYINILIEIQ